MTTTLASIKLPAPLVDAARVEGRVFSRSISGQVEHWAQIGRAIERASGFTFERIRAALAGEIDAGMLSASERDYFDDMVGAVLETPTPAGRAFWSAFDQSRNTDQ